MEAQKIQEINNSSEPNELPLRRQPTEDDEPYANSFQQKQEEVFADEGGHEPPSNEEFKAPIPPKDTEASPTMASSSQIYYPEK
jgi:hypothetical protein